MAKSTKDHDLLIEINTKLAQVVDDVKELKDDTAKRVSDLENEKANKVEFDRLSEAVQRNTEFIDNLKGKYSIIATLVTIATAFITAWLTKGH